MDSRPETAYPIHLTLTPAGDRSDIRKLTIKPGEQIIVGRASKSEAKNLSATNENALFDCPVVSREHAQLRAKSSNVDTAEVEIIDRKSMHGTSVNGQRLTQGIPFTLNSGDVIKFGDRVTRGANTHDGVSVTFERVPTHSTGGWGAAAQNGRTGYQVPSGSEEEDSDAQSDVDSIMSNDEPFQMSSAKTTPEQTKAKLGSQEKPIDVDGHVGILRPIISLIDDESDVVVPSTNSIHPSRVPLFQSDSFDVDSQPKIRTVIKDTYDEADEASDSESEPDRNTGLSQILNSSCQDRYAVDDDNDDDAGEDMYSDHDEDKSLHSIDEEYLSDSDASDLSNHADQAMAMSDDDGPEEVTSKPQEYYRPYSPELGTVYRGEQSVTDPTFNAPVESPKVAAAITTLKPRYDPVRGSNPPSQAPTAYPANPFIATSVWRAANYRHSNPYDSDVNNRRAGASRWDVGPGGAPATSIAEPAFMDTARPGQSSNHFDFAWAFPETHNSSSAWGGMYSEPSTAHINRAVDELFPNEMKDVNHGWGQHQTNVLRSSEQTSSSLPPAKSIAKTQMSIPNLVDDAHKQSADVIKPAAQAPIEASSSKSSKRKASEISEHDTVLTNNATSGVSNSQWTELFHVLGGNKAQASTTSPITSSDEVQRPSKRVKKSYRTTKTKRVAWEMTKLGAAAAAGSGALMAFLLSPLADRVLEWTASV